MTDFKGSKHDYSGWSMSEWEKERKRKDKVFNAPFREDTLCVFVGGKFNGKVMTVAEARETVAVSGTSHDWSEDRKRGGGCPYPIFDNAPRFYGYMGPMAGTSSCPLRYETSDVYAQLSA